MIAELELGVESVSLLFEGKEVLFPARAREVVEDLHARDEPFAATDLPPSLDDAGRLVVVRRLVREGYLRLF